MSFNAEKSKHLVLLLPSRRHFASSLSSINFRKMEIVSWYFHLGHIIFGSHHDRLDIMKRKCDFNGEVNNMLCFFREDPIHGQVLLVCLVLYKFLWLRVVALGMWSIGKFLHCMEKGVRRVWDLPARVIITCFHCWHIFCLQLTTSVEGQWISKVYVCLTRLVLFSMSLITVLNLDSIFCL